MHELDRQIAAVRHGELPPFIRGTEITPVKLPHEMILSGKKNSNGKIIRVRCMCMSGARTPENARRFMMYDPIAEVTSLEDAKKAFNKHIETGCTWC